jgi:hypothetical protein
MARKSRSSQRLLTYGEVTYDLDGTAVSLTLPISDMRSELAAASNNIMILLGGVLSFRVV